MIQILSFSRDLKFWMSNVKMAAKRYLRLDHPNFTSHGDALIMSPGGVATTFLIDHVSQYISINDRNDSDWLKHLPYIPKSVAGKRVLYIYGNAEQIYQSLKRREYHRIQAAKLGCPTCMFVSGQLHSWFCKKAINRQIAQFKNGREALVMCVDFDQIWERKREIAEHLGITDPTFVTSFPPRRSRQTNLSQRNILQPEKNRFGGDHD